MIEIPTFFMNIHYNGKNYPGASFDGLEGGANCQVFAYAFLKYHGITLPPLRSSELWEDSVYTTTVFEYKSLDLLLFHSAPIAFGAHVTVYVGDKSVLHLAKHHGQPAVELISDLLSQERYRFLIGTKRAVSRTSESEAEECSRHGQALGDALSATPD